MQFHYYYLIQDFVGVMLAFVGIRMLFLCLRLASSKKFTKNIVLLMTKYSLFIFAGANLLMNTFGLNHWICSILLMIISIAFTPKINSVCS
ncbi:hypothetical protein CHL78_002175 [Romboutsia weinsteinii]|uniref:Uncharacterized protein n=1 Tax=Romboutsia weinsteinii TaxID=2020949 RepID=A0A371J8S6_9FIRM|nr:hypothetical protein [Romboutsia weinsteinii]RDY29135.1 hypothetical protein CHL78_002175 [Romboutsia weinsteinii]